MKIIKKGKDPKTVEIEKTCVKCQTVFSYNHSDIQSDQRDGDYVICPVCQTYVNVGNITNYFSSH